MAAKKHVYTFICMVGLSAGLMSAAHAAGEVESFYRGKTMEFIVGYGAGGGYDLYARLVAQQLNNFIPGRPTLIVRNMPGGGGRVATSYVYRVAPQDGTILLTADQSLILDQALGDSSVQFDLSKMPAIGNPIAENNNLVTWYTSGIRSIDDAKTREIPIGAGPGASTQVPLAMNAILGTKFKIISGYTGGNEINLAMERGEVAGRGQNSFAAWRASKPDWLKDGKINFIVQWGMSKLPGYENVPLLSELAKTPDDNALLSLFSVPTTLGRPIFTTPNVPTERVAALREAFEKMIHSKEFTDLAQKGGFDLNPVSGPQMQEAIGSALNTPPRIRERLKKIIETTL